MFHSLYIILQNGTCVFTRHYRKSRVDDQLLSGFISALGNFSREALGSNLQSIKLQSGEQLSILKYQYAPIIGIVIADPRDHPSLISTILNRILQDFTEEFRKEITANDPKLVGLTQKFNKNIDEILKGKVSTRSPLKMILGNIISFSLMILIAILMIRGIVRFSPLLETNLAGFPTINFSDGIDPNEFMALQTITGTTTGILLLMLLGLFFLPSILSGYIAGSEKRGILNAILLSSITGGLLFLGGRIAEGQFGDLNIFWWFIIFSPLIIFIAIVCGYYGGHLKVKHKLWPLEKT